MYRTCIFCSKALGCNEAIEYFPVGSRLAFDAARGRLWAICPRCTRSWRPSRNDGRPWKRRRSPSAVRDSVFSRRISDSRSFPMAPASSASATPFPASLPRGGMARKSSSASATSISALAHRSPRAAPSLPVYRSSPASVCRSVRFSWSSRPRRPCPGIAPGSAWCCVCPVPNRRPVLHLCCDGSISAMHGLVDMMTS